MQNNIYKWQRNIIGISGIDAVIDTFIIPENMKFELKYDLLTVFFNLFIVMIRLRIVTNQGCFNSDFVQVYLPPCLDSTPVYTYHVHVTGTHYFIYLFIMSASFFIQPEMHYNIV